MNASDIQNALDRIIKQNRNLDESGLRVLLLASSWENENIETAISMFKARKDQVLSSLDIAEVKDKIKTKEATKQEQINEEVIDLTSKVGVSAIVDEVKSMHEEVVPVVLEKPLTEKAIEKLPELKRTEEAEVEVNKNELILPPSNKESSLGDLLSSSLKEFDKIPDEVFENKRSKGIDLESAPILVKNDGITPILDLKKEAIKNVLEGKTVKPLPKTEIKPEEKKEELVLKNDKPLVVEKTEEKINEALKPVKKEDLPIQKTNKKEETVKENKTKEEPEEMVLIQSGEAPSDHLIPDEETMEKEEKTSLIKDEAPKKPSNKAIEEIPHNLPLKPFDASPHVVAFSEYKEAFHGKEEKDFSVKSINKNSEASNQEVSNKSSFEINTQPVVRFSKKNVPLSKSEKELVITATVLLLFILLLLSYMYSNGRL